MHRPLVSLGSLPILVVLLQYAGCGGSSSGPDGDPEPPEEFVLVGQATIGPTGGVLAAEDFLLEIPVGAFVETANLVLRASSEDKPFGADGVTRSFRLSGYPASCAAPLKIQIAYEGALVNESFIAVGPLTDDAEHTPVPYRLYAAGDSSGMLRCELPPIFQELRSRGLTRSRDAGGQVSLAGVTDFRRQISAGGHFEISYPAVQQLLATSIAADLERAYNIIQTMGFSYAGVAWPVQVQLRWHTQKETATLSSQWAWSQRWTDSGHLVVINLTNKGIDDYIPMRTAASREFFHNILSMADAAYIVPSEPFPQVNSSRYWFHAAVAAWAEHKFAGDPEHEPMDLSFPFPAGSDLAKTRHHAPFRGLQAGAIQAVTGADALTVSEVHGVGIAQLIKYLVDQYGESFLIDTYRDMATQGHHPLTSLLASIDDPVSVWWPDFLRARIVGQTYSAERPTLDLNGCLVDPLALGPCWYISPDHMGETSTDAYPELSAKPFWIDLAAASTLDERAGLRVAIESPGAATGDIALQVFGFHNDTGDYVHMEHAGGAVQITSLRDLEASGCSELLVLVINNRHGGPTYTTQSNITLAAQVTGPTNPMPPFEYARVSLTAVNARFNASDGAYDAPFVHTIPNSDYVGGYKGHWTADTWVASWDTTVTNFYRYRGSMRVSRDPVNNLITSVSIQDSLHSTYFGADKLTTSRFFSEETEIPLAEEHMNYWTFLLSNPDLCVTPWIVEYRDDDRLVGTWREMVNWRCDSGAAIRVIFGFRR